MASSSSSREKICIPFQPLLVQITDCLDFPKPTYSVDDPVKCSSCVYIRTEGERGIFWFNGEAITIEESKENAAHRAVNFLIKKYGVCVGDFTMDRMRMYDLCGKLYRLKRKSLESHDGANTCKKKIVGDVLHVALDYVAFLPKVIKQTGVIVTGLETVHSEGQGYVSWLIVTSDYAKSGMECIFSELCVNSNESVQMVAKKTIYYIMQLYNVEIVDANYGAASFRGVLCSLERESCLAVEERKKGHKDTSQLLPFLVGESLSDSSRDNSDAAVIVPAPSTPAVLASKRLLGTPYISSCEASTSSVVAKRLRFV